MFIKIWNFCKHEQNLAYTTDLLGLSVLTDQVQW